MKKWALHFLISVLVCFVPAVNQAMTPLMTGARSRALSQATVALPGAEWLFGNPAAIAFEQDYAFYLHYDSPYLLRELSRMGAGGVIPLHRSAFGLTLSQEGGTLYCERKATLGYAMFLGREITAGVQFDLYTMRYPENRAPCLMATFEGGLMASLSPRLRAGVHLSNPAGLRMHTPWGSEKIPTGVRCGTCWSLSPELLLCTETEKWSGTPLRLKTGIEISPHPTFSFRCGMATPPLTFSLGAGFRLGKTLFDIAFGYHGILGFTPAAGFTWHL